MTIQLRQLCLVAEKLEPVLLQLEQVFGLERCFVDKGVAIFGLENTLMPIGNNFLEVVAPVVEGTTAERYLKRRNGDGGYMVITQADSAATQRQVIENATRNSVRVAFEREEKVYHLCQFHPRDTGACFLEVDSDQEGDFKGYWHPAGGSGWKKHVNQRHVKEIIGAALQAEDPEKLANKWSLVTGIPLEMRNGEIVLPFNNAALRFIEEQDGRGDGLSEIDISVQSKEIIENKAKEAGCFGDSEIIEIGGVRWRIH